MNEKGKELVESFTLDHTRVKAPFIRKCTVYKGEKGDLVTKYDIRFTQPNVAEMESDGIHTLEHLMATYIRDYMDGIIDLSPMGCRTGFYLTVWGDKSVDEVKMATEKALAEVTEATDVPAVNEVQCGNYRLHSLDKAKSYAKDVLDKGFNDKFIID
jgi:S-ribosylhomocysteine lyase